MCRWGNRVAWGGPLLNEVSGIKDKTAGNIFCFEFLHVSSALSDGGRRCYQQRCHTSSVVRFSALVLVYFHRLFLPLLLHDWPEKKTFAACRGERWSLSHSLASKTPFLRLNTRAGCNGPIASLVMLRRANCATATGQLPTVRLQVCTRQVLTDGTGSALKINMV